ncbi:hypothetical protein NMY22_g12952 [Coprinellus aureogranulatus]|nr:hypothetical protein NMY22_g12952 [Coprinellus aureogranulatus]
MPFDVLSRTQLYAGLVKDDPPSVTAEWRPEEFERPAPAVAWRMRKLRVGRTWKTWNGVPRLEKERSGSTE